MGNHAYSVLCIKGGREGGRDGGREGGTAGGREGGKEKGREGGQSHEWSAAMPTVSHVSR